MNVCLTLLTTNKAYFPQILRNVSAEGLHQYTKPASFKQGSRTNLLEDETKQK